MPMMPSFHRSADEYDEREEDPPEEDRSPQNHEAPGICASLLLVHMDDHWGCGLLYPRMQTDDQLRCCDYHICVTCATMPIISGNPGHVIQLVCLVCGFFSCQFDGGILQIKLNDKDVGSSATICHACI